MFVSFGQKRGFPRHSPGLHSVFGKVGQGQRYHISFSQSVTGGEVETP